MEEAKTPPAERNTVLIKLERALVLNEIMQLAGAKLPNGYMDLIFESPRTRTWCREIREKAGRKMLSDASEISNLASAQSTALRIRFCWKVAQMPERHWLDLAGEFLTLASHWKKKPSKDPRD